MPYELHPETPVEGRSLARVRNGGEADGRRAAMRTHLQGLAGEAGVSIRQKDFVSNSRLALEAGEFARDAGQGAFERFHRQLFRAYFEEARDVGRRDVLAELATRAGLDASALGDALIDHRYGERVDGWTEWAKSHGITATPTFVFNNRFALSGAQDYDVFRTVAERILASEPATGPA